MKDRVRPAHPRSVPYTVRLVTACSSSCFPVGGLFQRSGRACLLGEKGRKALSEQVNHTGPYNGECTDNRPLGLTLLWREKPIRQYGGHHGGKLRPLKRRRVGEGCDAEDMQSK